MSPPSYESDVTVDTRRVSEVATYGDATALLSSAQDVLGRKWHPVVVYHLLDDGPMRFSDLKRSVDGISSKMLSESLSTLETEDIVERTVLETKPIRVEYSLTPRGAAFEPVIAAMVQWGRDEAHTESTGRETDEGSSVGAATL